MVTLEKDTGKALDWAFGPNNKLGIIFLTLPID